MGSTLASLTNLLPSAIGAGQAVTFSALAVMVFSMICDRDSRDKIFGPFSKTAIAAAFFTVMDQLSGAMQYPTDVLNNAVNTLLEGAKALFDSLGLGGMFDQVKGAVEGLMGQLGITAQGVYKAIVIFIAIYLVMRLRSS